MDTGPSYSYQHDLKNTLLFNRKGKQICLVQTVLHLLRLSIS